MQLVPALCTQCKGELKVDPEKKTAVCLYCKTTFLTEEAINYYNMTVVNNIGYMHADVLNMSDEKSIDNRVKAAETFLKFGEYIKAEEGFSDLTNECPYDYRGWWGLIRINTGDLTDYDVPKSKLIKIEELYEKMVAVGMNCENENICEKYNEYIKVIKKRIINEDNLKLKEIQIKEDKLNEQIRELTHTFEIQYDTTDNKIKHLEKQIGIFRKAPLFISLISAIPLFIYFCFFLFEIKGDFQAFCAACIATIWATGCVFIVAYMVSDILFIDREKQYIKIMMGELQHYTNEYNKEKSRLQYDMNEILNAKKYLINEDKLK